MAGAYPYRPAGRDNPQLRDELLELVEILDIQSLRAIVVDIHKKLEKFMTDVAADFANLDAAVAAIQAAITALAGRIGSLGNTITDAEKADLESDVQKLQDAAAALGDMAPQPAPPAA